MEELTKEELEYLINKLVTESRKMKAKMKEYR